VTLDAQVLLFTAGQVERGEAPAEHRPHLTRILHWAKTFLVAGHPELGRTGPVCPYTQPSLRRDLFHLASPADPRGPVDGPAVIAGLRAVYERLSAGLGQADLELLTLLVVLPQLDHQDSTELDLLQRKAKDEFVAEGLMIDQFHPSCPEPGLWNPDFRPLRSPVPLLAVRKLLVFDLPFLIDSDLHVDSYLRRFAAEIPTRIRYQLVSRLATASMLDRKPA
jgi:hypothetical protein